MPAKKKVIRSIASRVLGFALGSGPGQQVSETLARFGLRGLGINADHDSFVNGELRFLRIAVPLLGRCRCADIGANVGEYANLLIACGAAEVYAFEPVTSTFASLKANLWRGPSFHAIHSAVGEYDGEVEIQLPLAEKSTLASRDLMTTDVAGAPMERSMVPITTLDQFCAERGVRFDFVKIDVEGFEMEVLKGAEQTLAKSPPAIVQFEINTHHGRRRQKIGDFELLLSGYRLFRVAEHALRPIDSAHYMANIYALQNVVAIRKDDARVGPLLR